MEALISLFISPVSEWPRFNKIALFSFLVNLNWKQGILIRDKNLPASEHGKLLNYD